MISHPRYYDTNNNPNKYYTRWCFKPVHLVRTDDYNDVTITIRKYFTICARGADTNKVIHPMNLSMYLQWGYLDYSIVKHSNNEEYENWSNLKKWPLLRLWNHFLPMCLNWFSQGGEICSPVLSEPDVGIYPGKENISSLFEQVHD